MLWGQNVGSMLLLVLYTIQNFYGIRAWTYNLRPIQHISHHQGKLPSLNIGYIYYTCWEPWISPFLVHGSHRVHVNYPRCWYLVNWGRIPRLDVIVKVLVPVLESRLSASLHKDAWTGCPSTPSKAWVRLWEWMETPREREKESSQYRLFCYSIIGFL